jgi:hypothetical protein
LSELATLQSSSNTLPHVKYQRLIFLHNHLILEDASTCTVTGSFSKDQIYIHTTLLLAFSVVLHLMLLLLIDPQLYIRTT